MSGVRAHISHYHVDAADGIRLIDDLAARGVDVSFDMYPYTRGCTLVAMALLPPEYSARSIAEAVALLGDPDERARLRADWFPLITDKPSLGPAWPDMVVIAHAPRAPRAAELSLRAEAARRGVDVVDATLDLLIENALEVSAVMAVRDERPTSNLARLFSHPAYTGGSDGIYIGDAPHPRGWGTFARLLGTYTREVGAFGWPQAVRRLAGLPAERYGLHDRGVLTPRSPRRRRPRRPRHGRRPRHLRAAHRARHRHRRRRGRGRARARRRRAHRRDPGRRGTPHRPRTLLIVLLPP